MKKQWGFSKNSFDCLFCLLNFASIFSDLKEILAKYSLQVFGHSLPVLLSGNLQSKIEIAAVIDMKFYTLPIFKTEESPWK